MIKFVANYWKAPFRSDPISIFDKFKSLKCCLKFWDKELFETVFGKSLVVRIKLNPF